MPLALKLMWDFYKRFSKGGIISRSDLINTFSISWIELCGFEFKLILVVPATNVISEHLKKWYSQGVQQLYCSKEKRKKEIDLLQGFVILGFNYYTR